MSLFRPTVRDFSKSKEGRQWLEALFNYNALPNPKPTCISSNAEIAKNLLGKAFEYLLQLVIERQNPSFEFEVPFKRHFGDARTKKVREIKHYFESGEPTDALLDLVISFAQERQKAFQIVRSRSKRAVQEELKCELRRIHILASNLKWTIKDSFYQTTRQFLHRLHQSWWPGSPAALLSGEIAFPAGFGKCFERFQHSQCPRP